MMSTFAVPIVMRPIDFMSNAKGYILGLICYVSMMPMYSNVFMIYSMSNLHDVSWGNRPANTGHDQFSAKDKE